MPYHYGKKKGKGKMKKKKKKMGRRKKQLFEVCPIKNKICAFCGYDKEKLLRCGFAVPENRIVYMEKCPLDAKKRKRRQWGCIEL